MLNEFVLFVLLFASALLGGGFFVFAFHVHYLHKSVSERKEDISKLCDEFKDITEVAAKSNNSHAQKLIEMSKTIEEIKSRQDMIDNTIRMTGKSGVWKN